MENNNAGYKEWIGLAAIALPTMLLSIDTSVLYLALPQLSTALKANSAQQLWVMDTYGFMIAGFLITMGSLGDRFGYRRMLIAGSAAFGLASVLAAFSPNVNLLIGARALMGISGAALMPSTLALIRNMFIIPAQRATAIAIWMSCFMAGMIVGPLAGGLILEHFWWGAVFLLGVPVMLVVVLAGRVLLPDYRHGNTKRLDFAGVIFSLAAILPLVYGLTELSRSNLQPLTFGCLITGLLFTLVFSYHQRVTPDALIDVKLFDSRVINIILIIMFLTAVMMGGIALFVTEYLQMVLGLTPFRAGMWMLPQAGGMILGSLIVPGMVKYIPPWMVIIIGLLLTVIGMTLLTLTPGIRGLTHLVAGFALSVTGVSPILVLGTGIIIGSAPPEKAGSASSLSETVNQLGIAIGVAFLGSIGVFVYRSSMINHLGNDTLLTTRKAIIESLPGAISATNALDGANRMKLLSTARDSFVSGFHIVTATGAVIFVLIAVLVMVGLRKLNLHGR